MKTHEISITVKVAENALGAAGEVELQVDPATFCELSPMTVLAVANGVHEAILLKHLATRVLAAAKQAEEEQAAEDGMASLMNKLAQSAGLN